MKRLHNLKFAMFIAGTALIAGTMFMPWGAMTTYAGPPLIITTPPPVTVTTPPPPPGGDTGFPNADPYVLKSAVCVPAAGETPESVDFTIIVGNYGPDDAVNVQVRDPLPSYLQLVSVEASPRGTVIEEPNVVRVDIGTLRKDELITIRVTARQTSAPPESTGINVASLISGLPDRDQNNNAGVATWPWRCSETPIIPPTGADLSGPQLSGITLAMLASGIALVLFSLTLAVFLRRRSAA